MAWWSASNHSFSQPEFEFHINLTEFHIYILNVTSKILWDRLRHICPTVKAEYRENGPLKPLCHIGRGNEVICSWRNFLWSPFFEASRNENLIFNFFASLLDVKVWLYPTNWLELVWNWSALLMRVRCWTLSTTLMKPLCNVILLSYFLCRYKLL